MIGNQHVLALLLSRLTAEEERRLKMSVSRSEALARFCEEAFKHKHSRADWVLSYGRGEARLSSRESTRKLCERLMSHVFQVLAGSHEVQERPIHEMDAAHASECVKCGVFIVQSMVNRGAPVRWLLNFLEKRVELCHVFGLVEDMVAVHSQRWLMMQQLTSPGDHSEPEKVYRDLLKATENMRFLIESEQFLFNYLEGAGNCLSPEREQLAGLERRFTDITLFNHRSRFVFLSFVQLILQSRIVFAKGDSLSGIRLVAEVVAMSDEFSEVTYRLKNSPYAYDTGGLPVPSASRHADTASTPDGGVLVQFPRFYGLVHEPVLLDLFYNRKYDEAEGLMQRFLPSIGSEKALGFPVRWYIMQGFIHFKKGEFQRASQFCRYADSIPEGKSYWSMAVRLLSIYISIENGALDLAAHQIESLRKYAERQHRIKALTRREHLIIRLFSTVSRSDFDFRKVAAAYAEELDLLASTAEGFAWVPGGYELIPFQEWLRGKAGSI